ncbi:MAG: DNA gyrase inhibitor YacG [Deltaproteobacteria bacterium]|nr:DNA gyrase inhibitor YacG [Deltaproteobacteria bacterium]
MLGRDFARIFQFVSLARCDSFPRMPTCPICRAPVAANCAARPFCSARCQKVDLGHWLGESYCISSPLAFELDQAWSEADGGTDDGDEPLPRPFPDLLSRH